MSDKRGTMDIGNTGEPIRKISSTLCPFYKQHSSNAVKCEVKKGVCIILRFDRSVHFNCYREKYCNTRYEACEIYKAIEAKALDGMK